MALILRSVLLNNGNATRPMAKALHANAVKSLGMLLRASSSSSSSSSTFFASPPPTTTVANSNGMTMTTNKINIKTNHFSTAAMMPGAAVSSTPGSVTKRLRVLDVSTVHKIQDELRSVDANSDGVYVVVVAICHHVVAIVTAIAVSLFHCRIRPK
jgi:Rieske Fe-S protein